ncbi:MAG: tetratricopeptide repeat protein [Verrucomicrobiae bacterium]
MRALLPFVLAVLSLASVRPGEAQDAGATQGMTAQEYYTGGERLYLGGKYAEASVLFGRFIGDFEKSKDAEAAIRGIRFRHAMCFVRLRKFADAIEPLEIALGQEPPLQAPEIQELQFWLGVSRIEEKNYPDARAALEKFLSLFPPGTDRNAVAVRQFPAAAKIPEARLLIGSAWILEGKFREAAGYFAGLKSGLAPDIRSRAVVLQLYSLLHDGQNDEAMKIIGEEFPRLGDFAQIITFQSLTLELGNRWLEAGEFRKAIICLQRVWTADRLLKHQQSRLEELRLRAADSDAGEKFLLGRLIQNVGREIENFRKIESFDAALRLRLAAAYQGMKRYREAALILEDMLGRMPPDKVVEQASVNLVQMWFEIERWPKVSGAAAAFQKKFPNSKSIPLVLYLEGLAAQKDRRFDEAAAIFDTIPGQHAEFAPRALFMKGFTLLLAEKYAGAIKVFEKFGESYPDHELAGAATYWRGMGFSLDRKFAKARDVMGEYLKRFHDGQYAGGAVFRKAYCAQQMEDYTTSIRELRSFLRAYPGHEEISEARILLGDALMNEGKIQEGIAVFQGIRREDVRFYEEGVFKTAKALKLLEEYDRLLDLMTAFKKENPRSPRVAEAVFQIGWVHRQKNRPEKAREVYWEAIREHGGDPAIRSVDALFPALARLYRGDEDHYLTLLSDLQRDAEKTGRPVLAMRALWARAGALKKSDPGQSRQLLLEAGKFSDVQTTNPLLLADFATALRDSGKTRESLQLFRDLVKWNPAAPQKDRALAAIGFAEIGEGNEPGALAMFDRFENGSPGSLETGRVLLAKAGIEERLGHRAAARKTLETLLAAETSSGKEKAEALFRIGQIHMAEGKPELAIPYFQRIYVMHGRWRDWVAKAYLRSGEAFEKLNDTESARKTYGELTQKEDFSDLPEFSAARKRLEALGGPPPTQG